MVIGLLVWHAALLGFAVSEALLLANILLFMSGLASSFAMVAMSAVLMAHAHPSSDARAPSTQQTWRPWQNSTLGHS